jgi:hypothetical protein
MILMSATATVQAQFGGGFGGGLGGGPGGGMGGGSAGEPSLTTKLSPQGAALVEEALTKANVDSIEHDVWMQRRLKNAIANGTSYSPVISKAHLDSIKKHIADNKESFAKPENVLKKMDAAFLLANAETLHDHVTRAAQNRSIVPKKSNVPRRQHPDDLARNKLIEQRLETAFPMAFPNETPFEDVMKYIQSGLDNSKGTHVAFYVDPVGLATADKTLTSPVHMELDGVPLRVTLKLLLEQLGMVYRIRDGMIIITSAEIDEPTLDEIEPAKAAK